MFCIFENLVQAKCLRNVDVQWLHGDLRGKSLSFECGNCKLYLLDIKCVKYVIFPINKSMNPVNQ